MTSNQKGNQRERELVNALDAAEFAVMRAPASGSATERELPDVLAGNGKTFVAIEHKSSGSDVLYIDEREIEALTYFAENFGARELIGVRFDVDRDDPAWGDDDDTGIRFIPPRKAYRTPEGNYRVKKDVAYAQGLRIGDL